MPPRHHDLPAWARAADAAAIALLFFAAYVAIDGGFVVSPGGFRVSVKSEWRVLLWASILILARHILVRAPSLPRRIVSGIARANQAAGPLGDDAADAAPLERQPRQGNRRIVGGLLIVGLFSALTLVMTYPQIRGMGTHVSFNDGDPLFSAWRLAWVAHQLPRDPLNLFNANIFHPEPRTLALSDAMLVPALMAAPLLWLGVPQLVAYNLVFLASFALSGAAMFLLVRSLTGQSGAALVAGFIFAFLPYRYMHYPHLELQVAQWMPLCLWALHRTVRTGRLRDGLLTGLFLALQALSSLYYGIFLATFMVPVGAALLIGQRASSIKASIRSLAAGGVLAAVLIVPVILPYLAVRHNVGERTVSEITFYSATAKNYLAAHPQNVVFGSLTSHLGAQERELFTGFLVPLDRADRVMAATLGDENRLRARTDSGVRGVARVQRPALSVAARLRPALPGTARAGAHGDGRRPWPGRSGGFRRGAAIQDGWRRTTRRDRRAGADRARRRRVLLGPAPRTRAVAALANLRRAAAEYAPMSCSSCRSSGPTSQSNRSTCISRRSTGARSSTATADSRRRRTSACTTASSTFPTAPRSPSCAGAT